jgi:cytochrome P450
VHNPSILKKLTDEIRSTFETVEDINSGLALNLCTYLRAVIDEAMRLSPPVGGILPREVLPGGLDVDGIHIPEGTYPGSNNSNITPHKK